MNALHTIALVLIGSFMAALLAIFPDTAPPYAWYGVLACFVSAPVVLYIEYHAWVSALDEITRINREFPYPIHKGHDWS